MQANWPILLDKKTHILQILDLWRPQLQIYRHRVRAEQNHYLTS